MSNILRTSLTCFRKCLGLLKETLKNHKWKVFILLVCLLSYGIALLRAFVHGYLLDMIYPDYLCIQREEYNEFYRQNYRRFSHIGRPFFRSYLGEKLVADVIYYYEQNVCLIVALLMLLCVSRVFGVFARLRRISVLWGVVCVFAVFASPIIYRLLSLGSLDSLKSHIVEVHEESLWAACKGKN
jgi:hypothetical protein